MCLPYMRQRAESISNVIIHSTPNAIFALTEDLDIQEANQAACRIFNLENDDYKHKKIYEFIDCPDIDIVKATKKDVLNSKIFYENYNLVVEQSILYINENHMIVIIMKDITNDEKHQIQMHKVKTETVEIAQKVIEKQMRVAQEIASLLGETTAETKVALTKLKNAIQSEMGDER
jgi:sensor histidine kinase regulating citrate/malate metabolism